MSDEMGNVPPEAQDYQQVPPPPPLSMPPTDTGGLSDSAAGALAYVTIIPAIIFLLIEPYKNKPFIKFHCIQCLGLAICGFVLGFFLVIPLLGLLVYGVGMLCLLGVWIMCVLKASQGGAFKLPVIGKFASEQSGYAA